VNRWRNAGSGSVQPVRMAAPDKALPVVLEVREPVRGVNDRGPVPCLAHASRTPSDAAQKRISCSPYRAALPQPLPAVAESRYVSRCPDAS
jgi:hypothetical protein